MSKTVWVPDKDALLLQVCPWRYIICLRTDQACCPVATKMPRDPDLTQWKHAVAKAVKCQHTGANLTVRQWEHRRLGHTVKTPF